MMAYLAVFVGGGLGSVARYAWGRVLTATWTGPVGLAGPAATAAVNLAATALLVFLLTRGEGPAAESRWTAHAWLLATTGFCGGFSTFSTFAADTVKLYTTGHPQWALANVAINVFGCLAVALWGMGWKLGS
ncbi:MAG: hypothetical protein RJA19_90 [Bacteroidota bacterium]|jgi:CrcB protein